MVIPQAGEWKTINRGPHCSVMGICYDRSLRIVLMHRSAKVRSACNAWSFPSGLHENGLTLEEQLAAELREELNLEARIGRTRQLGTYENISAGDSWHWVITVMIQPVETLDTLINREPDKHDEIQLITLDSLKESHHRMVWSPGLGEFISKHIGRLAWLMGGVTGEMSHLGNLPDRDELVIT